jgi:hypothetical protein
LTTEQDVGKGAGTAIGIAAAACSAVPGIGTATCAAAAAIASAFVALGTALSAAARDTYHPHTATALSWATVWLFLPGTLWTDNDTLQLDGFHNGANIFHPRTNTPVVDATRLVRYTLIIAGLAKPSAPLYNPGDKTNTGSDANPYIEATTPDPHHPLTDHAFVGRIWTVAKAHGVCSPAIPSLIRKRSDAVAALAALRSPHFDRGIFTTWSQLGACLPALRREVQKARALAGESGPDPILDGMLGGPTAPPGHAHHAGRGHAHARRAHDPRVAGLASGATEGLGFGLGLLPGLFIGGSLVALGAAAYQRTQASRAK